jgi:hypothetical protein
MNQRNAATFGDHQGVCKVSSTPEACGAAVAIELGRCPVRAQGSKVRFADHPVALRMVFSMIEGSFRAWLGVVGDRAAYIGLEPL